MANTPYKLPEEFVPGFGVPGEKPTIPVEIDWSHPLGDRVVSFVVNGSDACAGPLLYFNGAHISANNVSTEGTNTGYVSLNRNVSPSSLPCVVNIKFCMFGANVWQRVYFTSGVTYSGIGIQVSNSNKLVIEIGDNTGSSSTDRRIFFGTSTLSVGWHNVTIRLDGLTSGQIILDGKDETFTTSGSAPFYASGSANGEIGRTYHAGNYYYEVTEVEFATVIDSHVPNELLYDLHKNPYQILKPKIDTFYFVPADGGGISGTGAPQATTATTAASGTVTGAITGTGSPSADTATSSGAGLTLISGSGAATSETATAAGIGLTLITGSASIQADTATTTASGTVGSAISGSGSPQAENATTTGVGLHLVTGSGSVQAVTSTASGTGLHLVTGSSASQADTATTSAIGVIGDAVVGSGSPQAESATSTGQGLTLITGTGSAIAETATSAGSGLIVGTITGSASVQAGTAYVTATGIVLTAITGTASVQATTATASGTDTDSTTIHPRRVYTVEPENRTYTVEAEDRVYVA